MGIEDPERAYRHGYNHGAWAVIEAVSGLIPAREEERLKAWFRGPATGWERAAITGESKRGPNGEITIDIGPPPIR
jgi:hypothetical protein